ncbi:MAG: LysE family transporter [Oscillospiraceae bacterium]
MEFFLQGLTMGIAYVAPIGMQNMFVIETALSQKRKRAFLTALIIVFFDVTLALACFFGVGAIMERYEMLKLGVLLIGSLIVIWIGIGLIRSKVEEDGEKVNTNISIPKIITTACVVTWFNPQALIDGTMMFGAFRATIPAEHLWHFMAGSASASIMWFFGITALLQIFHSKFTPKILRIINVVCGCVIIFYGLKLLYTFITLVMA